MPAAALLLPMHDAVSLPGLYGTVKVAVAEVEDYYYLDDDDDDQYGDGHYDEDRHGYEVMAEFVDQWARQSGFLERDNLEEIIEMLGSLPEWLKKLLARKSLGWFEEIAEAMDCPIGTVRSRIFRAREAIDAVLKPLMD